MSAFRFDYRPGAIRCGRGSVDHLGAELAAVGSDRALVVTGRSVGETPAVMGPVREGLGDRLAGVFAATTPEKRLATAAEAAAAMAAADADALVGVGGGSSLDVATVAAVVAARDDAVSALARELAATGSLEVPADGLAPHLAVPTTLAGADLSPAAGVNAGPESGLDRTVSGSVSDPRLLPAALCADPGLVETTPAGVLCASAMNGFDKAVETPYAATATPLTDATASAALERLRDALPTLGGDRAAWDTDAAVEGVLLAQYGVSRTDASTLSVVHAFGHGLRTVAGLHQGRAHAAVAPAALRHLFEHVDGRRELLADALGATGGDPATGVVAAVTAVRDGLGLAGRLRELDVRRADLDAVAAAVREDRLLENAPLGYDPSVGDLRAVLDAAW